MSLNSSLDPDSKHGVKNIKRKSEDKTLEEDALGKLDVATFTNLLVMSHSPQSADSLSTKHHSPLNDIIHLMGYNDYSEFSSSMAGVEGADDFGFDALKDLEKEIEEAMKENSSLDFQDSYDELEENTLFSPLKTPPTDPVCVYCGINVYEEEEKEWDQRVCGTCSDTLKASPRPRDPSYVNPPGHCNVCNEFIKGASIEALGVSWCPSHFQCTHCKVNLIDYMERDGKPYCKEDFKKLFGIDCLRCKDPIKKDHISALGEAWHLDCFRCIQCELDNHSTETEIPRPSPRSCQLFNGELYCERHYHKQRNSTCPLCKEPVVGPCLSTRDGLMKFHPYHFQCSSCQGPLSHPDPDSGSGITLQCNSCHSR